MREAMDMGMPFHDFVTIIMPHCSGLFRFFGGLAMHMNGATASRTRQCRRHRSSGSCAI
jgi:aldehyde dehydrogenase (NAD+)